MPCLSYKLLASRTAREYISVVLGHLVFDNLFWQPQEMNTGGIPLPFREIPVQGLLHVALTAPKSSEFSMHGGVQIFTYTVDT